MNNKKKPRLFRGSRSSSSEKNQPSRSSGWLVFLFFVLIVASLGAFFEYGLPYLARFSEILGGFEGGESNEVTTDAIPPSPPQLKPLPEATNSATLSITGEAEPKSEVTVFLNGDEAKKTVVDSEKEFSLSKIDLTEGENYIFALAKDLAGNVSQRSVRQVVVLDKEAPELQVTKPEDGQNFPEDKQEITIEGKTESDAVVHINERQIVVDLDGNFSATYSLSEGANDIVVVAQDKAGNQTKEELTVHY